MNCCHKWQDFILFYGWVTLVYVCVHYIFFLYLLMDTLIVSIFWLFQVMLLWTLGCMYLFEVFFSFLHLNAQKWNSWILWEHHFFFFLRNLHSVFGSGCTNLHCYQQYMRIFFSSNPYQHLIFLIFVMIVTLTSVRWYLIMVLICISPMARDVEVFSRAYYLSVCLWKNACLGPLLIFWIGLFVLSDI